MKIVDVRLKDNPYKILIGHRILPQLGMKLKAMNIGQDAVIITHPVIARLHGKALISGFKRAGMTVKVIEVPAGEKSKSAKEAFRVIEQIARHDVMRNIFIVAFGGGVIGDLAGFVASVYKRGVPYVQVPTTFLSQIDSAIGGKVAIDLPVGKNLVGSFYQPKLVYSDTSVLSTLDKRQMRNGLAEAVKYGVILDKTFFSYLERNFGQVIQCSPNVLTRVIFKCSQIKTKVVLADEKETKSIRTVLNFGHTLGHAIETAGGYDLYHHGEAIALGMRIAADISRQMGIFSLKEQTRLNQLLSSIGLPAKIQKIKIKDILHMMKHDKKFLRGKNRFVLAKGIGRVEVVSGIRLENIISAIGRYL